VRRLISRTAAFALSATVALGAAAVPCAAGDTAAARTGGKLTRLSPASRQVLATAALDSPKPRSGEGGTLGNRQGGQQPAATPSSPSSFFKSTRGKVTLALMGAGTGLTLWSIQHDRKPVKSPVR
jgi:hypothetical protein